MRKLLEFIESETKQAQEKIAAYQEMRLAAIELGLDNVNGLVAYWSWTKTDNKKLYIQTVDEDEARGIIARLLTKVGKFTKRFDESNNKLEFVAKYNGFDIKISTPTPSTCTVEIEEEEVFVPAEPERYETRKKYVLKGDCSPFMG